MNNTRSGLPTGRIFTTAMTLSLAISGIVHAQTAAKPAVEATPALEEIVVTGTSIKGLNAETALPVQVLKREDIERTGVTSTEDLFRTITSASAAGSVQTAQGTGVQTGSLSAISLRGLGSSRTLVLINGRRSAVYGGGSAGAAGSSVDISAIPLAAIERVEILKDGASAVYGSDAIAGVVNFILRSDYQGAEFTANAGVPTRDGGGAQETFSAFGGLGDLKTDKYNVTLGVDYYHQSPILGSSRSFATRYSPATGTDGTSSFAFPANIVLPGPPGKPGATVNPFAGNCGPASINDVNTPARCQFDNDSLVALQPEQKKINENLGAHLAIGEDTQLYLEESFGQTKTIQQVQPVPLSSGNPLLPGNPYIAFLTNLLAQQYPGYNPATTGALPGTGAFLLPPSSPYYPTAFAIQNGINGQPLNLIYRDFANGPRLTEDVSNALRVVGGIKGNALGWDYDAGLLYSEVKVHENLLAGYAQYSQIMPLLDSGTINPFGPTTDPAAIAAAKATEFVGQDFASKTSIASLNGTASRAIVPLPGGDLTGAVGAEVRRETFVYDPALAVQTGDIAGQGGNQLPEDASRSVESAFFELNAPFVHGLDGDAAVRWDRYQGVGSTVNPKGSLKWQPTDWVLLRASAGTGFRAPSLTDLFASQARSVTGNGTRDPIKCPTSLAQDPNNPACSFQFTTITGGNPNLTPEKSTTLTLGTVFQPVKNFSIDLDSFWIYLKNQIVVGGLPVNTILASVASATQFASLITRDANGNITAIAQTNENLFKSTVSGLDTKLRYAFDLPVGRISLLGDGTYYYKYAVQNANGSWTGQLDKGVNTVGFVSRFRYTGTVIYDISDFSFSMTQNWQKKYHDSAGVIAAAPAPREVSAYDTVDAQLSYVGVKQFKFTLGARNVFDKNPPFANYAATANNFVGGYDLSYGDPVGRFVYASATFYLPK